jgi:hypothetical protein
MVSASVSVNQSQVTRSGSLDPGPTGRSGTQHAKGTSGIGQARLTPEEDSNLGPPPELPMRSHRLDGVSQ